MLPNIKTESAVLRKCLAAQYGLSLATHQSNEIVARMKGFGNYQELLRGIDKLAWSILDTDRTRRAVHAVTTAHYFSGEDEVCYLLAHILNEQGIDYFTVEARGSRLPLSVDNSLPDTVVMKRGEYMAGYNKSFAHADGEAKASGLRSHFSSASNHLIAGSPIFPEVMLLEHRSDQRSAEAIGGYVAAHAYEAGIISTGEGKKWSIVPEFASWSDFTCVFHVAIAQTYTNIHNCSHVIAQIHALRKRSPDARIVAWIFEDDCASNPADRQRGVSRRIFDVPSRKGDRALVDGLGWVAPTERLFFEPVMSVLHEYQIPFIKVPHYSGHECFLSEAPHPRQIEERDRVTADVVRQFVAQGFKR